MRPGLAATAAPVRTAGIGADQPTRLSATGRRDHDSPPTPGARSAHLDPDAGTARPGPDPLLRHQTLESRNGS